jgi:GT2 family glycosyltransferase
MRLSVIIPTFNRSQILRKTLEAYGGQSTRHDILEVIVIDDGSTDDTRAVVEDCGRRLSVPLRYLYQKNSGLAAARNHAIREAAGDLLLLGDDDIIPSPDMVAEHVAWHNRHPEPSVGVLGYVTWAPEVHPTPFMKWSGLHGPQFSFGSFKPGMELDFRYGYFCNTTVKASFLKKTGCFSETFRQYGWEDIEFSYRLSRNGYKLLYNPAAFGYHYKYETFENTRRRVESLYKAWPIFAKTEAGKCFLGSRPRNRAERAKEPAIKRLLRPLKAVAMPLLKPLVDTRVPLPGWLYDRIFYHYVAPLSSYMGASE